MLLKKYVGREVTVRFEYVEEPCSPAPDKSVDK